MTTNEFKTCEALSKAYGEFNKITESSLHTMASEVFITGGAIGSFLRQEQPNDIDIYFENEEALDGFRNEIFNQYKIPPLHENGIRNSILYKAEKKPEIGDLIIATRNAMTFKGENYNFQVVTKFWGHPNSVIEKFDFANTQVYYDIVTNKIFYNSDTTIKSIYEKELIYTGSLYPLSSLFRIKKFMERGWNIYIKSLIKLAYDIYNIDLSNPTVLANQLEGVDMVVLAHFIDYILENQNTFNFLTSDIIDEIFFIIEEKNTLNL